MLNYFLNRHFISNRYKRFILRTGEHTVDMISRKHRHNNYIAVSIGKKILVQFWNLLDVKDHNHLWTKSPNQNLEVRNHAWNDTLIATKIQANVSMPASTTKSTLWQLKIKYRQAYLHKSKTCKTKNSHSQAAFEKVFFGPNSPTSAGRALPKSPITAKSIASSLTPWRRH